MEHLEVVEAVQEERQIVFHQSKTVGLYNEFPIMSSQLTLQVKEHVLLDKTSFQLPLGKKIAIAGENGVGKSTLLHHISNNGAGLTISSKTKIGYFRQMSYRITSDETVLEFVKNHSKYDKGFLRSVLHAMKFTGTDIQKMCSH